MSSPDSPRSRRRIVIWVALAAVLLLAAGAGAYVLLSGGDVSNPDVEFRAEPTETPAPPPSAKREADFVWPLYGYSPTRRHYLAAPKTLRPPFKRTWSWNANSLLEFTPVIAEGKLFVIKNNGGVYAIDQRTGKAGLAPRHGQARRLRARLRERPHLRDDPRAQRVQGRPRRRAARQGRQGDLVQAAAEPQRVLAPVRRRPHLLRLRGRHRLRAAGQGRQRRLALQGGRRGQGRARARRRQALLRRLRRPRPRDPAEQRQEGVVGDDARRQVRHRLRPVLRQPGRRLRPRLHRQHGLQRLLVLRRHRQARLAHGHGRLRLRLRRRRAGAGRQADRLRRLLRRRFYALDAKTGKVRWKHKAPGRISGAATVVGDIVYFGDLQSRTTTGLGARTGRKVFRFGRGGFNPVVSDGRFLYVVGYSSLSRLRPR